MKSDDFIRRVCKLGEIRTELILILVLLLSLFILISIFIKIPQLSDFIYKHLQDRKHSYNGKKHLNSLNRVEIGFSSHGILLNELKDKSINK